MPPSNQTKQGCSRTEPKQEQMKESGNQLTTRGGPPTPTRTHPPVHTSVPAGRAGQDCLPYQERSTSPNARYSSAAPACIRSIRHRRPPDATVGCSTRNQHPQQSVLAHRCLAWGGGGPVNQQSPKRVLRSSVSCSKLAQTRQPGMWTHPLSYLYTDRLETQKSCLGGSYRISGARQPNCSTM